MVLTNDLMPGCVRNQVRETLERHGIAVPDILVYGFGQTGDLRHKLSDNLLDLQTIVRSLKL